MTVIENGKRGVPRVSASFSSGPRDKTLPDAQWRSIQETQLDEWQPFEHPKLNLQKLTENILFTDPPSLTLAKAGRPQDDLRNKQVQGNSSMRVKQMDSVWHSEGVAVKHESVHGASDPWGTKSSKLSVSTTKLIDLFRMMTRNCRYPPSALEFDWRLIEARPEMCQKKKKQKFSIRGNQHSTKCPEVVSKGPRDLWGQQLQRPFALQNNKDDPGASQPPHFLQHQLRPEQLQSLNWMLQREGAAPNGSEVDGDKTSFVTEWRHYWVPPYDWYNESNELAGDGSLCPGSRIRIKPDVKKPKYGWGMVHHLSIGTIKELREGSSNITGDREKVVVVDFPEQRRWTGLLSEIERVASENDNGEMVRNFCFVLDLRVRVKYRSPGGILGDKIGYGKTATTIGLIDSTTHIPLPPIPEVDQGSFIPANGTLIVVPSNLFGQWLDEISKFLWDGRELKPLIKSGWIKHKDCPLKIFAISSVVALQSNTAQQVAEADIVICSYRILFSDVYQKRRPVLAGGRSLYELAHSTNSLLNDKAYGMAQHVRQAARKEYARRCSYCV